MSICTAYMRWSEAVYNTCVYCLYSTVWNPFHAVHSQRIETIQRSFTRHLAFIYPSNSHRQHHDQRLPCFDMTNLRDHRLLLDLPFPYKILRGTAICNEILTAVNVVPHQLPRQPIHRDFASQIYRTNKRCKTRITRKCNEYNAMCKRTRDIDIFHDPPCTFAVNWWIHTGPV